MTVSCSCVFEGSSQEFPRHVTKL